MGNLALIVPNASNRLVVGQNIVSFVFVYRRDPTFLLAWLTEVVSRVAVRSMSQVLHFVRTRGKSPAQAAATRCFPHPQRYYRRP
jgi:hypothetical protein